MSKIEDILSHSDCLSQEQMNAYLSKSLGKEQTYAVENHLADCMFCNDAIEGLEMLSAEENNAHVTDIKSDIEKLIFTQNEEETLTATKTGEVTKPSKLKARKGGKTISWRAAAGIFLLIFASGLAVFSYINNNTDWMKPKGHKNVVKGENSNAKEVELEERKSNGRELETYSIDAEDLKGLSESEKIDGNQDKKNTKSRKNKLLPPQPSGTEIAKNESPPRNRVPTNTNPIATTTTEEIAEKPKVIEDRKDDNTIAKVDTREKESSYNDINAGARNTYTQPLYEGKMKNTKDINNAPAVSKSSSKKQRRYEQQADMEAEKSMKEIDAIQSQGYGKKGAYKPRDYHSEGVYAFNQAKYKESVKLLKKALRNKNLKNRDETLYYLALAYEKTNDLKKARKIYEQLSKSDAYKSRSQSRMKLMKTK